MGKVILFQGDSITDAGRSREDVPANVGLGVGYPYLVGADLLYNEAELDWQIFNRGISGNRVVDLYARWKIDALNIKPDILSILIGVTVVDFVIPLFLKNGQTLGKKVFGIGLVRVDGVQLTTLQLFVRTILGKFAIELMVPTCIVILLLFNAANIIHLAILAILIIAQIACVAATRTNSAIHDLLAGTVAIDIFSQQIFRSSEELLEYTKKIHAERADRSGY